MLLALECSFVIVGRQSFCLLLRADLVYSYSVVWQNKAWIFLIFKDLDLPTAAVVQEKVHLTATSTHSNLTEHQKNSIKAKTNPGMSNA